jgi:FKBP-type peptidyl-prolyl cis-trans isomerase FklB
MSTQADLGKAGVFNPTDLIKFPWERIKENLPPDELVQKLRAEIQEENKQKEGVITLESGLQYKIITTGNGAIPKSTDSVKCHYEGRLINGMVFDSSYRRGEPAVFPVNGVIAGWVEALQLMPVGSKWQLYIPSELAYGSHGAGQSIGPNETLIFDIELLDIV